MLNKKPTQYLGVWLNNSLKFREYINKRVRRAYIIEIQITSLTKTHKLMPRLV